jgi:hypothetical protein
MLSPQLSELLGDWWRIARPPIWLFPGHDRISPMTTRQLNRVSTACVGNPTRAQAAADSPMVQPVSEIFWRNPPGADFPQSWPMARRSGDRLNASPS